MAVAAGFMSNASHFFTRVILKDGDDATAFGWYSEFLRFAGFAAIAFFDWELIATAKSLVLLLVLGLVECLAVYYWTRMHSLSHLSISAILSRTRLIWVPIIALVLVGERLGGLDYIGIAILFIGVSIAVAPSGLTKDAGAKAAVLSAFFISVEIVLMKMLVSYASNGVIQAVSFLPAVFILPLLMRNAKTRIMTSIRKNTWLKIFAIAIILIANYVFVAAIRIGDVSKINAIYQGMMIVSVLAGIFILKERENIWKKIAGSAIVIIGAILLS